MGEDDDYTRVLVELTNVLGQPVQRTVKPMAGQPPAVHTRQD